MPGFPTSSPEEGLHVKMKLTAKLVAGLTLPPGKTDHIMWDSELPGFGYRMRLGANDKVLRTYIVQHKRGGRTSRLQQPAAALSAEQARAWARRLVAQIALGEDPAADRAERRGKDRVTLKSMIDEHLLQKQAHIKLSTLREDQRYLTGPYFKPLHNLPVDQITRKDVAARLVIIGREHSSIVARGAVAAEHFLCVGDAIRAGHGEPRGRHGQAAGQHAERARALRRRAGGDLAGRRRRQRIRQDHLATGPFGRRRGEIGGIAWSELSDLDGPAPVWTLPARAPRTAAATALPLGPLAVRSSATCRAWSAATPCSAAAPTASPTGAATRSRSTQRAGVGNWTVHDLRRTAASRMADNGTPPHVIEEILNHRGGHRGGIGAVYIRSNYRAEVHAALLAWEDRVRSITAGVPRKVVPMTPNAT